LQAAVEHRVGLRSAEEVQEVVVVGDVDVAAERVLAEHRVGRVHVGRPRGWPFLLVANGGHDRLLARFGEQREQLHRELARRFGRQLRRRGDRELVRLLGLAEVKRGHGAQRACTPLGRTLGHGGLDLPSGIFEQQLLGPRGLPRGTGADARGRLQSLQTGSTPRRRAALADRPGARPAA
jgi:hypothetical protein